MNNLDEKNKEDYKKYLGFATLIHSSGLVNAIRYKHFQARDSSSRYNAFILFLFSLEDRLTKAIDGIYYKKGEEIDINRMIIENWEFQQDAYGNILFFREMMKPGDFDDNWQYGCYKYSSRLDEKYF